MSEDAEGKALKHERRVAVVALVRLAASNHTQAGLISKWKKLRSLYDGNEKETDAAVAAFASELALSIKLCSAEARCKHPRMETRTSRYGQGDRYDFCPDCKTVEPID